MLRTAITASRTRYLPLPWLIPPSRSISVTSQRPRNRSHRSDAPTGNEANPTARQARSRFKTRVGVVIGLVGGIYYYSHLEEVPQTGRRRFMNVGEEWDSKIAETFRNEIISEHENRVLPQDHPLSEHVQRVLTKILHANKLGLIKGEAPSQASPPTFGIDILNPDGLIQKTPSREWEVIVVNEPRIVNAFSTPGIIVVCTGILPICRNDDGLAAILSHEVGHIVARHVPERISSATLALVAIFSISSIYRRRPRSIENGP